jgi:hypothetical protein
MSLYIDLFDDDLYEPIDINTQNNKYTDHLNAIRMQVLLAILFRRQIVIPEQWAVSSATFLKVAAEVVESYEQMDKNAKTKNRFRPVIPFVIAYQPRELPNICDNYAIAVIDRLSTNRRIQHSYTISQSIINKDYSTRSNLQGLFTDLRDHKNGIDGYGPDFVDKLIPIINDEEMAYNISTFGNYLIRNRKYASAVYDPIAYSQQMGKLAGLVKKTCFEDLVIEDNKDYRIPEIQAFFIEAEKRSIGIQEIMKMWDVAENYKSSYNIITNLGRYCMHRGLASTMRHKKVILYMTYIFNDT